MTKRLSPLAESLASGGKPAISPLHDASKSATHAQRLAIGRHLKGADPGPREIRAFGARLAAAGVPLILIPASLPLANELQYRLPMIAPDTLARLAVLALASASLVIYLTTRRRRGAGGTPAPQQRFSTAALLHNVYYPVFVATCALFKTHQHQRFFGELDNFHLGEETVPTQQWLEFGSVPMIDLRLAHTFSDCRDLRNG